MVQLEANIDHLVQEIESFKTTSEETRECINKHGHSTHLINKIRFNNDNEKKILEEWHQYKLDLKARLEIFYKVKFNPDLKYNSKLLESLGFQKCSLCHRKEMLELSVEKFGF